MKTHRDYAIVSPIYCPTSAGIRALYQLSQNINEAGFTSRIVVPGGAMPMPTEDEIVLYPDCFCGNMFKAKRVIRMLFMHAGYFGQDKDFPESEYMYYYTPEFILNGRNPENILTVPMMNEERFPYKPQEERSGSCYLAIKYCDYFKQPVFDIPLDCIRLTNNMDLSRMFGSVKTLLTFDNSMINLEAAFAGVEVIYRFNSKFNELFQFGDYWDYAKPRESYQLQKSIYYDKQLPEFIERTQKHFFD